MAYVEGDFPITIGGNGNNNGGFGDGNGWWVLIILFALFGGWGNNGNNGGFGGYSTPIVIDGGRLGGSDSRSVYEGYVLQNDFSQIANKLNSIGDGICDSTFALNNTMTNGFAGVQQTLCQGFSGLNQGIVTNGYQTRLAVNDISRQLSDCCCDIRGGIKDVAYGNERNSWTISNQISDCCCNMEKMQMQNRFDNSQNTCATLQAIDKVGDRIVDYLASQRAQDLRDENFALRLAASQERQNNYLVSKLGYKCPEAAYIVPNPNCCYNYNVQGVGYNNGCGGCNGGF